MTDEHLFPEGPQIDDDARLWATLCHAGGFANFIGTPFVGFIAVFLIWVLKRDTNPFVDEQGREALNFQITYFMFYFTVGLLCFVLIGLFLLPLVPIAVIAQFVLTVIAVIKVNDGKRYRYPFILRFF